MYQLVQSTTFSEWISKLRDRKAKQIIASRLMRIVQGTLGDSKGVGDGISELRIHYGPGYRIYFQVRGNKIVLLLCGGDKTSQSSDIDRARSIAKMWKDKE